MQDKDVFKSLDQKFNTQPTEVPQVIKDEAMIDNDFDQARMALKMMIKKGETAVDEMINIARQSDHPRAFEVTGQLIKTVSETAKDLLALQKQKKELSAPAPNEAPKQIGTQNNIVFSGNTNDLLKLLKTQNEKVIDASDSTQED
jgi:hypothetical protein